MNTQTIVLDTPTHTVTAKDSVTYVVVKSANDYHARTHIHRPFGTDPWGNRCELVEWCDSEWAAYQAIVQMMTAHDNVSEWTDADLADLRAQDPDASTAWYEGPGVYDSRQLVLREGGLSGGYDVESYQAYTLEQLPEFFDEAARLRLFEQSRAFFTVSEKEDENE